MIWVEKRCEGNLADSFWSVFVHECFEVSSPECAEAVVYIAEAVPPESAFTLSYWLYATGSSHRSVLELHVKGESWRSKGKRSFWLQLVELNNDIETV